MVIMKPLVRSALLFSILAVSCMPTIAAFPLTPNQQHHSTVTSRFTSTTQLRGWLDNFLPKPVENYDDDRRRDFPEQYPATYELLSEPLASDKKSKTAQLVRPLLKQTMLEDRELQLVYDAQKDGWSPTSFHKRVDGKGAAIVVARSTKGTNFGGYNPKGWSSNGGTRPSVAAFLFYTKADDTIQKLQKVGGGGLACGRDDPEYGIAFGPDALVIPLSQSTGRSRLASSKLGPYFERGPEDLPSLFTNGSVQLESLQVLVGVYGPDEEIPYSGAVMDMTSG